MLMTDQVWLLDIEKLQLETRSWGTLADVFVLPILGPVVNGPLESLFSDVDESRIDKALSVS